MTTKPYMRATLPPAVLEELPADVAPHTTLFELDAPFADMPVSRPVAMRPKLRSTYANGRRG